MAAFINTKSGAGIAAPLTGNFAVDGVVTATLPTGVIGTLQFTRTLLAAPYTKSNIASAIANAVNSLTYQIQTADVGYSIGIAASNQVTQTEGGAVTPTGVAPLRAITVNNHPHPTSFISSAGNDLFYTVELFHFGTSDNDTIILTMPGGYMLDPVTGAIINASGGYAVQDMALQDAAGGNSFRVPLAGATVVVAPGTQDVRVQLAPIRTSSLGPFSVGAKGYGGQVKTICKTDALGGPLPGQAQNASGGQRFWTFTGNTLGITDIMAPGFFKKSDGTFPPSAPASFTVCPIFLGTYVNGGAVDPQTLGAMGDSQNWGTGDATASPFGAGQAQRIARGDGTAAQLISCMNMAVPGMKMTAYNSNPMADYWLQFVREAHYDGQTNDIGINGSWSLAQAQALDLALWARWRSRGVTKIHGIGMLPRCPAPSTWTAIDGSDQTPAIGWTLNGVADQLNAWRLTQVGSPTGLTSFTGKPDARLATDANKFNANGTAKYFSDDGTHGTTNALVLTTPPIRAKIVSFA